MIWGTPDRRRFDRNHDSPATEYTTVTAEFKLPRRRNLCPSTRPSRKQEADAAELMILRGLLHLLIRTKSGLVEKVWPVWPCQSHQRSARACANIVQLWMLLHRLHSSHLGSRGFRGKVTLSRFWGQHLAPLEVGCPGLMWPDFSVVLLPA